MSGSSRSHGLDFLKILATIAIVFHHFQADFDITFSNHINFSGTWFYWGYMVELFFTLSGYFMDKYVPLIYDDSITLGEWIVRRAKRLLPTVAVSAVCYEFLYVVYWGLKHEYWAWDRAPTLWGIIITALGLQEGGAFPNPHVNNVTWYIGVLLICYTLFFILTKLSKKIPCSPYWIFAVMIFVGISIKTSGINLPYINQTVARGYCSFFYGVLLSKAVDHYGITRKEISFCAILIALLTLGFVFTPNYLSLDLDNILSFLFYPALIILFDSECAKKIFHHSFWGTWGQVSYNVYIWHVIGYFAMDIVFILLDIHPSLTKLRYMYLYLAIIEVFGVFSHFCIEKPLNNLVDRMIMHYKLRGQKGSGVIS